MNDKLEQLKSLMTIVNDSIDKKSFEAAFRALMDFVKKIKETNAQETESMRIMLQSATNKMVIDKNAEIGDMKKMAMDYCAKEIRTMMAEHKSRMTEVENKLASVRDGVDGRSPMHTGKYPPDNPQKGDLWYQD